METSVTYLAFSFTSTSPHNGYVSRKTRLFFDRPTFDAVLAGWNRQGWKYEETPEDAAANAAPEPVRCYETTCAVSRSEGAWRDRTSIGHRFVVRAHHAEETAEWLGCTAEEAARLTPSESLDRTFAARRRVA